MINFYAQEYVQASNRYTYVHTTGMWAMESKIEAYKKDLEIITNQLIQLLKSSTVYYEGLEITDQYYIDNAANYVIIKGWEQELEGAGALQNYFEGSQGLFANPCDFNGQDISSRCMLDLIIARTKSPKVVDPALTKAMAFSEKSSEFADKFFGHFMDYYMMARQLNNFDCMYLPTYRTIYEFSEGVEKGSIFAYFDIETARFYDEMIVLIQDIADNIDDMEILAGYYSGFVTSRQEYQNFISVGITEMETIFLVSEKWLESLYLGVKIISTANIVLTADSTDDTMLLRAGATAPGYIDTEAMPPGISYDRARMLNELHVSNYCTQIALQFKPSIAPDFSNFEYIMAKTVTISLTQTGCLIRMQDLNDLLVMYPTQYL